MAGTEHVYSLYNTGIFSWKYQSFNERSKGEDKEYLISTIQPSVRLGMVNLASMK